MRQPRAWSLCVSLLTAVGCTSSEIPIHSADPVATLTLSMPSDTLQPGETTQLFAAPRDARGRVLAGRVASVTSTDPAVASVSPGGVVTALSPGSSQIVVSIEGRTAAVAVKVVSLTGNTAECIAPRPGWIWCDDFEEDRLGRYFEYGSKDGSFERVPGVGYGGSFGMRARFASAGQVSAGFLHLAFGKNPSPSFRTVDAGTEIYREIYWRVYVRYAPGWVGGGGAKMSRAQSLATTDFAQAMIAHVWSGSGPLDGVPVEYLAIVPASGTDFGSRLLTRSYNDFPHITWLGTTWSKTSIFDQAHVGKWYCIEAHARLNDPGRSNGLFDLWIDDRLEARQTRLNWLGSFRAYGINTVYLENYWNGGAPQPQERYFDNFVVSTQRIACS